MAAEARPRTRRHESPGDLVSQGRLAKALGGRRARSSFMDRAIGYLSAIQECPTMAEVAEVAEVEVLGEPAGGRKKAKRQHRV